MPRLHFTTTINCPPDDVFNLIADLSNYGRWLSSSRLFQEMQHVSDNPIKLGTTYTDQGKASTLHGTITEFKPPANLTFQQGTRLNWPVLRPGLDITIRYTLEGQNGGTSLVRDVDVQFVGLLKLAQPMILRSIRAENERILSRMKAYLEGKSA